jgi:ribonuclease HII
VTDSKKLTEAKREKLYHMIEKMQDESRCQYSFASRDAIDIDSLGIREANRQCMQDVMLSLLQFTDDTDTIRIMIKEIFSFAKFLSLLSSRRLSVIE